jgi:hypothetical protein
VLCAASLVFWSITLVVLVKYVIIVMLADDNGEGASWLAASCISRTGHVCLLLLLLLLLLLVCSTSVRCASHVGTACRCFGVPHSFNDSSSSSSSKCGSCTALYRLSQPAWLKATLAVGAKQRNLLAAGHA